MSVENNIPEMHVASARTGIHRNEERRKKKPLGFPVHPRQRTMWFNCVGGYVRVSPDSSLITHLVRPFSLLLIWFYWWIFIEIIKFRIINCKGGCDLRPDLPYLHRAHIVVLRSLQWLQSLSHCRPLLMHLPMGITLNIVSILLLYCWCCCFWYYCYYYYYYLVVFSLCSSRSLALSLPLRVVVVKCCKKRVFSSVNCDLSLI